jgi:hypothetical protein
MFIYGNSIMPTKKEAFFKSELRGLVVDKYRNQKNHNTRIVRIKETKKEIFTELVAQEDTLFYNYVSTGDSITKLANQDFLIVRRQDSISKFKVFTYD